MIYAPKPGCVVLDCLPGAQRQFTEDCRPHLMQLLGAFTPVVPFSYLAQSLHAEFENGLPAILTCH